MKEVRGEESEPDGDETQDDGDVGLAENTEGVAFQCGTCEYFGDDDTEEDAETKPCQHPNKKLNGREVEHRWCCNKYEHEGMKIIVE